LVVCCFEICQNPWSTVLQYQLFLLWHLLPFVLAWLLLLWHKEKHKLLN
jgi:uncharacterized membrane protein